MSRREKNSKKKIKTRIFIGAIGIVSILMIIFFVNKIINNKQNKNIEESSLVEKESIKEPENTEIVKEPKKEEIIITAVGDCTLGTDVNFSEYGSFQSQIGKYNNDYSKIMENVRSIFESDDYTIANLETTFTDATVKAPKGGGITYHFKGPKEYAKILTTASIEGVTISNNHTYDYGQKGLDDTRNTLNENKIDYCGYNEKIIKEIKKIKIGFLGYNGWSLTEELKNQIKNDIKELKDKGCSIVIPYFHWGNEREKLPNNTQIAIARFSIDSGADMVLGSHPHVLQSIESYKGKMIVYSLGNFSFGGNSNPTDKNTMIIQSKFNMEDDIIKGITYKVIPTRVSSVLSRNDYTPTIMQGNERENLLNELNKLSPTLNGHISDEYFSINY